MVECGGFESRCPGFPDRGFESPSLRHPPSGCRIDDTFCSGLSDTTHWEIGTMLEVEEPYRDFRTPVESETRLLETGRIEGI